MKFNHKITFENESSKNELVEKYRDDLIEYIKDLLDGSFDFDIKLHVTIRDIEIKTNFVNNETDSGYATMNKDGSFLIVLGTESLERIPYDEGLDAAISIFHELGHIYDLHHVLNNKYYKINPLITRQKYMDDYIIQQGWTFWTEFFAYYFTFDKYKGLHDYPTFHQLLVSYKKLIKNYNKLQTKLTENTKEVKDLVEQHINKIKQFTYALAKYITGSIVGKQRYYSVKVNPKNKKFVIEIDKILNRLTKLALKLTINTYGKGMARKLWNIGDYILRTFYVKYNIIPIKRNGYIVLACYKKD